MGKYKNILGLVDSNGNIVVKYKCDAFGNVLSDDVSIYNPIRYKGYYYDSESNMYYCQSRYYSPELYRWINIDNVNFLEENSINGMNLFTYCNNNPVMGMDPTGNFSWGTFWTGVSMVATAVAAIALSVTTFGAGIPLGMAIVAGVTLGAGVLTGVNGVATMIEAGTNYNIIRDGIFNNIGLSDSAYNIYASITEGVAAVGSMILGFYHMTGQYKAAKYGQDFLGKGYYKAGYTNAGTPRYVSSDGLRQMRFDAPHMYKGNMIGKHMNLEMLKGTKPIAYQHVLYDLFKIWKI